jgi:hypothetical protein
MRRAGPPSPDRPRWVGPRRDPPAPTLAVRHRSPPRQSTGSRKRRRVGHPTLLRPTHRRIAGARRAALTSHVIYQKVIAAYADPNRGTGKQAMSRLIDSIRRGVPAGLEEVAQLGRNLWRRRHDILAFFDHHASNGPTEAINGRLESLAPQRPRVPQPHPLPTALTATQRRAPHTRQRTLNYKEPANHHEQTRPGGGRKLEHRNVSVMAIRGVAHRKHRASCR